MNQTFHVSNTPDGMMLTAIRKVDMRKILVVAYVHQRGVTSTTSFFTTYYFHNGKWQLVLPQREIPLDKPTDAPSHLDKFFFEAIDFLDA